MFNCSIYTSVNWAEQELVNKLAFFLQATIGDFSTIEGNNYLIDIDKNLEYNEDERKAFPDGFLYFRYIIFIGFGEDVQEDYCRDEVSKVLQWFWNAGETAIASCDYEHLLPENGGYKSRNVPW